MKYIILIVIFFAAVTVFTGQAVPIIVKNKGIPTITTYSKEDYHSSGTPNSFIQDNRGIIYFGFTDGIVEFDGTTWKFITTLNKTTVRGLAEDQYGDGGNQSKYRKKGRIFVGSKGDIGYLSPNQKGDLAYHSILNLIPETHNKLEDIWKINISPDAVYFQSEKAVYVLESDSIRVLTPMDHPSSGLFRRGNLINGSYYIKQRGLGILKLDGNTWSLVPGSEIFATVPIYNLLAFNDKEILIVTNGNGMFLWDGVNFRPWITDMEPLLKKSWIHKVLPLSSNYFAMGTWDAGLVILDRQGKIIQHLTQDNGLISNLVYSLGVDQKGNLWVGDLHGICYIETASPFSHYEEASGITGNAYTAEFFDEHLYVGTSEGIFKSAWTDYQNPMSKNWHFQQLLEKDMVVFKLLQVNDKLLFGSLNGIWEITKGKEGLTKISPELRVLNLATLKDDPNHILVATINGLGLLKKNTSANSTWKYQGAIKGFDKQVFQLEQDSDGKIWAGDRSAGIYQLVLNEDKTSVINIKHYKEKNGLPSDLNNTIFNSEKEILAATSAGIYRYNSTNDQFEPHPHFAQKYSSQTPVHSIVQDVKNNYWYWQQEDNDKPKPAYEIIKLGATTDSTTSILKDPFQSINWSFYSFVSFMKGLPDSTLIFGTPKGFIHYDESLPHFYDTPYECLIRKVEILGKQDSAIFNGACVNENGVLQSFMMEDQITELPYSNNALRFTYSAPIYSDIKSIKYQFQLNGFDKDWSSWSDKNFKEYTNIPEGSYQFMVRAKNINEIISEVGAFKIEINPPFYRSILAYLIYIILATLGIREIVRFKNRKLIKDKAKLEEIVKNRTRKIERQKEVIILEKGKADKLLLNILPRETANELKETGSSTPKSYKKVTVLFTDFKGFTKISESLTAEKVVEELNTCFLAFDTIAEKHNLEKIKTIGDAYMAAGGVPGANESNPVDAVLAALEMIDFIREWGIAKNKKGESSWHVRIGIHTGELVAGVVGKNKFAYDIWGDTVNTASRMESSGEPGKVNISQVTYELIKNQFECEYRGKVTAKNKGEMDMYFVLKEKTNG